MIRQTVTCDICGAHKFEANHWFMAFEHKGTLKISPWGVLNSVHPRMKHLCGQKCLHMFVDDFLAGHPGNVAAESASGEVATVAQPEEATAPAPVEGRSARSA
jgi:hypothetical protein